MDRGDGSRGVNTPLIYTAHSPEELSLIAHQLAERLKAPTVICFFGDLGAGKTTFIKALAQALGAEIPVNSPTFQYLNIYSGKIPLYHFDLYRLRSAEEFLLLGFDEFFDKGIVCIEWAERIEPLIPKQVIRIVLSHISESSRTIKIII